MIGSPSRAQQNRRSSGVRGLALAEVATVSSLFVMAVFFARPLLEEWGFFAAFRSSGATTYWNLIPRFSLRPLVGIPLVLEWLIARGSSWGVGVGFGLLLMAKYGALRWAVNGFVSRRAAWVIATLGTVLVPWTGEWTLRNSGSDLAPVFLYLALGASLRYADRRQARWFLLCATSIALTLATHESLTCCDLLIPVLAVLRPARQPAKMSLARRGVIASAPVALGLGLYGVYALIAKATMGSGYEGDLAGTGSPVRHPVSAVIDGTPDIYRTLYAHSPWTILILAAIMFCLVGHLFDEVPTRRLRQLWIGGAAAALGLLPLLALPYAVNPIFLGDPDRVGFPLAVGFVLLVTGLMLRFSDDAARSIAYPGVVVAVLLGTLAQAHSTSLDYNLENEVITATQNEAAQFGTRSVVVQDYSGRLGDVLTLYETTLRAALAARGSNVAAQICTPLGVDRINPYAQILEVPTTLRCNELGPLPAHTLLLNVVEVPGGGVTIEPAGTT